ncbi:MAG: alpha/beta hydrolase [Sciscionella sp.]
MPVLLGAEAFNHQGSGGTGVLLCHGFTGSPQSMRPWGEALAEAGYTVRCPRLPGHGTSWQECNRTRWQDWYDCVAAELDLLLARCASVFACGLSMGGTLALRLAEQRGAELAGLVLVNPSVLTLRRSARLLPLLKRVLPSLPGVGNDVAMPGSTELAYSRMPLHAMSSLAQLWPEVRGALPRVRTPLVLLHSPQDHVVEPVNATTVLDSVGSADTSSVELPRSYHVATLDYDASLIFRTSIEFIERITGQPSPGKTDATREAR